MYCEPSLQFSFEKDDIKHEFKLDGVPCAAMLDNGCLLVTATGFTSPEAATNFFCSLQRHTAALAIDDRISISIPLTIKAPDPSFVSFMPEDRNCIAQGWPSQSIQPLMISNLGAWWYPEHEYVAIYESVRIVPRMEYAISQFAQGMRESSGSLTSNEPLGEELALAVAAYGQVKRSTQAVWSFLLTVMVLEMLSTEAKTSKETREAVDCLVKETIGFRGDANVDVDRIRNCLGLAKKQSITTSLKNLIRRYCCPGVAATPANGLFADVEDCDKKITAIYQMRSKYLHEGRVRKQLAYNFVELHSTAVHALGHILKCMLQEAKQPADGS